MADEAWPVAMRAAAARFSTDSDCAVEACTADIRAAAASPCPGDPGTRDIGPGTGSGASAEMDSAGIRGAARLRANGARAVEECVTARLCEASATARWAASVWAAAEIAPGEFATGPTAVAGATDR
jgi:hypothetical protein